MLGVAAEEATECDYTTKGFSVQFHSLSRETEAAVV